MLLECVKLRGGGTGMSTMTAVDKYGEVMVVVARMTEWIYTSLPSSGLGVAWAAILQTVLVIQSRSLKFFTYLRP